MQMTLPTVKETGNLHFAKALNLHYCNMEEVFSDERIRAFDLVDDTRARVCVILKASSPARFLKRESKSLSNCGIYYYQEPQLTTLPAYNLRRAKMALPPLPDKEDYLATGLEPVEELEQENCAICRKPKTDPVTVGCDGEHTYCRECIVEWL
jgi:hypothetical protein